MDHIFDDCSELVLHFDGLCEPRNPGGVAVGAFAVFSKGELVLDGGKVVEDGSNNATNNVAEWSALGLGLKAIMQSGWRGDHLEIVGDSMLVVNQLTGRWRMKAAHLVKYMKRCQEILECIGVDWSISWVSREENEIADAVGRRIYSEYQTSKGRQASFARR